MFNKGQDKVLLELGKFSFKQISVRKIKKSQAAQADWDFYFDKNAGRYLLFRS
jgi:hypothetical protein